MRCHLTYKTQSDEEDSDEESNKAGRSRFIDDEAAEDGNEDAFSPDYEEGEEGRNENSGGQETFEMETFFSDVSMIMEDFGYDELGLG